MMLPARKARAWHARCTAILQTGPMPVDPPSCLCREFLRSKQAGLLHVTIRRAVSLPAADPAPFTSDPYLVVCVGDSCFTTRTILNNLNPEWHESCTLFVRWGGAADVPQSALNSTHECVHGWPWPAQAPHGSALACSR